MLTKTSFWTILEYTLKVAANMSGKIEINRTLEKFYLFIYFIIIKAISDIIYIIKYLNWYDIKKISPIIIKIHLLKKKYYIKKLPNIKLNATKIK
jgi:hypothetical protein